MNIIKKTIFISISALIIFACNSKSNVSQSNLESPEWSKNAVIYELNVRQFTPSGTFTEAETHLQRIKNLGVNIIWLMPVTPIGLESRKGSLGSYYSVKNYKEINPEFGTFEDFRKFVITAHNNGLKIIIDWVANHTSRDAEWIKNKSWYILDSTGSPVSPFDWSDVAKLNYSNDSMRNEMFNAMKFWIETADVDGFRCDVAAEVPVDFWDNTTKKLRSIKSDIFFLAEAEKPELQINSFNSYYAWNLHHIMNQLAQGKANSDTLRNYLANVYNSFPKNTYPLNFTSNHDENSWNGTEFERMGIYAKEMAALTFMMPGIPMIYNGQEVGFNKRLDFFEKDTINWEGDYSFTELYQKLSKLRKENIPLSKMYKGEFDIPVVQNCKELFVIQYYKGKHSVAAFFNFTSDTLKFIVPNEIKSGRYFSIKDNSERLLKSKIQLMLIPGDYNIYYK